MEAKVAHFGAKCMDLRASWAIGRSYWPESGNKFGHFVAMLKLSWAVLGHVDVRFCSAMLLVLNPKMLRPQRTKILSGFLRAMLAL